MKKKKWYSLLAVVVIALLLFTACTPAETTATESASASTEAQASTEASGEESAPASASTEAAAGEVHEIYQLMPKLSLAGIVNPYVEDRADLDKAWPKEPAAEGTLKIGWTEINQSSDWFIAVKNSAEEKAKEYGYELEFLIAEDDPQTQSQHIDTFITQGVDIIVVDPVNSSAPVADINRAVEAGIPVLCVGAVPENCAALTTLCSNTFMNGYLTGQYMAEQFAADEGISATMIVGVMGSSCTESRLCGAVSGILKQRMEAKGTPYASDEDAWLAGYNLFEEIKSNGKGGSDEAGFQVTGYGTGDWTIEGGLAAAEDLCTANAGMNLMISENDFMAAGALKALTSANMKDQVKIGSVADGTREGLDLIKSGDLLCTGLNSGIEQGEWAIDFIHAIFEEGKDCSDLPLESLFTPGVISKENVDEMYDESIGFYKTQEFQFPQSIPELKAENQ